LLSTSLVVLLLSFDCSLLCILPIFAVFIVFFTVFGTTNTSLASFSSLNFLSALSFDSNQDDIFGPFYERLLISASVAFYRPQYFVIVYKCHFLFFQLLIPSLTFTITQYSALTSFKTQTIPL
jgi:hypothetical protein